MRRRILIGMSNNTRIIYPENSAQIIQEIIEKYGFLSLVEEGTKKFTTAKNKQERDEIIKNLPGYKLADLVIYRAKGSLSFDDFVSEIKESLKTDNEKSKQIAEEIDKKIIPFIKVEKNVSSELLPEQPEIESSVENTREIKKFNVEKDDYRENIE
jgi:hypothetical protein